MEAKAVEDKFAQLIRPLSLHTVASVGMVKSKATEYAHIINAVLPDCREKTEAISKLEESALWAEKGLQLMQIQKDKEAEKVEVK
jgi:hypothetical protein